MTTPPPTLSPQPVTPVDPRTGPADATGATTLMRAFIEGLTKLSMPAVVGTLLVALAWVIGGAMFVTPSFMGAINPGYLLAGNDVEDDFALQTCRAYAIAADRNPAAMDVVVMGASAMREAVVDAELVREPMARRTGREVDVHLVMTAGMTHWEAVAVCDVIKPGVRGVVALEVSAGKIAEPLRLLKDYARLPRMALVSPAFDREVELASVPVRATTGNYFLDHLEFFTSRPAIFVNLVRGPREPRMSRTYRWRTFSPPEWEAAVMKRREGLMSYEQMSGSHWAMLERLITAMQSGGQIKFVLLESPRNPATFERLMSMDDSRAVLERYEAEVRQFASRLGIDYIDVSPEAELKAEHFMDTSHIKDPAAKSRFGRLVGQRLAALMPPGTENTAP